MRIRTLPLTNCRLCKSTDLALLFSLGPQYPSHFPLPGEVLDATGKVPITLVRCRSCTLVQQRYSAPQRFSHYWYRSGVTDTMKRALLDVVEYAENFVILRRGDTVLDIGSNDGTLLRLHRSDVRTIGVEPALNLAVEGARGITKLITDYWPSKEYFSQVQSKAKVITACGMFYDLEDPNPFVQAVQEALHPAGVFVAQLMCLQNMIDLKDVGNLAHEHLEFYTITSLQHLYGKYGLKIVDIQKNDVNGGSYRIAAVHSETGAVPRKSVGECWLAEKSLGVSRTYEEFFDEIDANRRKVMAFILKEVGLRKTFWIYGASTKGNVLAQYYDLDTTLVEGASDRSPEKWGRRMIGSGIPIFSEEEARKANPDYFIVLPYAFLPEFVKRESSWRAQGGKFLVPLPSMRIV